MVGTTAGSDVEEYKIQLGLGENPSEWKSVYDDDDTVVQGVVGKFPVSELTEVGKWTVRLLIKDDNQTKEARGSIDAG